MAEINSIGYDIILDDDGDFQTTSSGDIFSSSDDLNIVQAIKNRISTEQGDLIYNKDYGLNYNLLFTKKTDSSIKAIKSSIIREISKDPRIKQIKKVDIMTQSEIEELRSDQLYIEIEVVPINKDEVVGINFIYPQFTSASFSNTVVNENQTSYSKTTVFTNYIIKDVSGIYLSTDTDKVGTNYYTGGSFNGRQITLGTFLNINSTTLIIDYTTYEVTRNAIDVKLIENEAVTTTSTDYVSVENLIYDVAGVFLLSDANKSGTNYWFDINGSTYLKGTFSAREIQLGQSMDLGSTVFQTNATQLVSSGQIEMSVQDASGFSVNQYCLIDRNLSTQESIKIREIDGNTLKFNSTLTKDHSSNYATVELNTIQVIVDYSSSDRII